MDVLLKIISKAHSCRLDGEHTPGLECLSDGQILPILLAMDPDTLLRYYDPFSTFSTGSGFLL